MDRISLAAEDRKILGKKVKSLRRNGLIPAHVFGNKVETEHVSIKLADFLSVYSQTGSTGLINLKIGADKVRPVMVRGLQINQVTQNLLHVDFYQVDLSQKVTVPVPIVLVGEDPELVSSGEAVVIQPLSEVQVEALPTDLIEKIEVDKSTLKAIGDSILISQLVVPSEITILTDSESVVVKLDTAVTEEMKKLIEEQAAEAVAQTQAVEGEEVPAEGTESTGEIIGTGKTEDSEPPAEDRGDQEKPSK